MRTFTPSPQQQAFFDWITADTGNVVLQAVAGAGKTTTLLEGTTRMQGNILFMAYGKDAAADIKAKADEKGYARAELRIGTVHAVCNNAWRRVAPEAQLMDNKVGDILDNIALQGGPAQVVIASCKPQIQKLVGLGKSFLMGVPDLSNPTLTRQRDVMNVAVWAKLAEHYGLTDDLPETLDGIENVLHEVIQVTITAFERSASACRTVIDFDDMIYAPLRFRARFFKQDWILGDEWQDANPARREAVRRMCGPNTRVVFVGDSRQDIFGFTGTGNDSLGRSAREFNCKLLDLTVTYRCPKAVVAYLHKWVSHIQAHPDAPEGAVINFKLDMTRKDEKGGVLPWYLQAPLEATDAIICRYNKPLVETAFGMLRAGIACKVQGRDIGKNLIALAQRWKVKTLPALEGRLQTYLDREIAKARAANNERKEQDVKDRVDTLRVFITRCRDKGKTEVECVVTEILDLFSDKITGMVTLCSGHKSKGREWGRVYWLQAPLRSKRPLKEHEQLQEDNISYVIGSRVEGVHGAGELVLVAEDVYRPGQHTPV